MSVTIANNACRVCLREQEIMINLFDTVEDFQKQRLSDLLEECSDLMIDETDNQPKLICDECTSELLVAAKFREKCRRTIAILAEVECMSVDTNEPKHVPHSDKQIDEKEQQVIHEPSRNEEEHDIIIEESDEVAEEEEGMETIAEEASGQDVVYEEVDYIENEADANEDEQFHDESIIVFEPEDAEEDEQLSPVQDEDRKQSIVESFESETNTIERAHANASKKFRTDVTPRPLKINCKCDACGAGFTHVNNLTRHMQTHSPDEIFSCAICKHPFITYAALEEHSAEHDNGCTIPIRDLPDEQYETSEKQIIKSESPPRRKNRPIGDVQRVEDGRKTKVCTVCNKHTVSKSALEAHMRTHTGDRPFGCDQCPKTFRTQGGLVLHLRRHSGLRPYKCNVCNKSFGESSNLRVHLRTHTGEKPHKCTICNRSFARVFLLQIHQRTHTGERPYQCSFCDKAFAQRGDLASHKRTHTGERPHVCPYCKKGFIKSSGLTQHMRKHVKLDRGVVVFSKENCGEDDFNVFVLEKEDSGTMNRDNEMCEIKVEDCALEYPEELET